MEHERDAAAQIPPTGMTIWRPNSQAILGPFVIKQSPKVDRKLEQIFCALPGAFVALILHALRLSSGPAGIKKGPYSDISGACTGHGGCGSNPSTPKAYSHRSAVSDTPVFGPLLCQFVNPLLMMPLHNLWKFSGTFWLRFGFVSILFP